MERATWPSNPLGVSPPNVQTPVGALIPSPTWVVGGPADELACADTARTVDAPWLDSAPSMQPERDRANRHAWGSRSVAEIFVRREGFINQAEAQMIQRLAREVRGQPILDIGVGGGRTTTLLRSISADYVGIDYLESLVQAARRRHPDVRYEHMDARDLSAFGDGSFALVVFSHNGIDGLSHHDRRIVVAETHRVLRPRGLFAYSTMNLEYRGAGHRPAFAHWRLA